MSTLQDIPFVAAFNRESQFLARNCNNTPVPVYVQYLMITPDPIVMVGDKFTFKIWTNITVHEKVGDHAVEVFSIYLLLM